MKSALHARVLSAVVYSVNYWTRLLATCAHAAVGGMGSLQPISSHGAINVGIPLQLGKPWIFSSFQNTTHKLRKSWK